MCSIKFLTFHKKISFVQCNCIRCKDATEMGTYSSALLCSKCGKGIVLSSNAQIIQADWKCDKCDFVVRHLLKQVYTYHRYSFSCLNFGQIKLIDLIDRCWICVTLHNMIKYCNFFLDGQQISSRCRCENQGLFEPFQKLWKFQG